LRRPTLTPNDFRTDTRLVQAAPLQAGDDVSGGADLLSAPRDVRSIFLSDIHLGTRACQAERLLSYPG
jgi:hypothetical protein